MLTTAFAHERVVLPGAPGPNRLDADVDLLSKAKPGLHDLRLYDARDREVGYILVLPQTSEPRWIDGAMLAVTPTKTTSGFELDLGRIAHVDRIRLEGIASPFLKRATLEGSGDRTRWTLLADATVFDLPDQSLHQHEIAFAGGMYRYLRVTWDDRSSARVRATRASARLAAEEPAPAAATFAVPFVKTPSEPGRSRYRITLPGPNLPIAAVHVDVASGNVLRAAEVTEPTLSYDTVIPRLVGRSNLRRAERDGMIAAEMSVPVAGRPGREIDLEIADGNNPPLDIAAIRVELARQPWIYFESPDGAPLRARYGDAKATPPLYDLEAVRPGVEKRRVALAKWGEPAATRVTRSEGKLDVPRGGKLARDQFRISRRIPDAPAGLAVLLLDAHALAYSNDDLADVRIVDERNRQVPYLVEHRSTPVMVGLTVPPRTADGRKSIYRLELPYDRWPHGTRLVLTTNARVFERDVVVRRVPDTHRNRRAVLIASSSWRNEDPDALPPRFDTVFAAREARAVEVVVDEGDNEPLPITSAELVFPSRGLRFHHPGTPLFLVYGNRRASAPRYDLSLLTARLFGEPARELALASPVEERGEGEPAERKWFWMAVVVAAVVLIAMLLRLVLFSAETSRAPSDTT